MKRNDILTTKLKNKIYEGWKSSAFDFLKKATNDATHKINDLDPDELNTFTSKLKRKLPSLTLSKEIKDNAKNHIDNVVTKVYGPKYKVILDKEDTGLLERLALKRAQAEEGLNNLAKNQSSMTADQIEYFKDYYNRIIEVSEDRMTALVTYGKKVRKSHDEIIKRDPRQTELFGEPGSSSSASTGVSRKTSSKDKNQGDLFGFGKSAEPSVDKQAKAVRQGKGIGQSQADIDALMKNKNK